MGNEEQKKVQFYEVTAVSETEETTHIVFAENEDEAMEKVRQDLMTQGREVLFCMATPLADS